MKREARALPELLSPAGSEEALRAALAAGADAVYFGGSAFSNRMRAKNFTDDGLTEAIRSVHAAGAAAHITVNTRVRDREMDDALRLADRILGGPEDARADAVIIADLGLAAEIRKRWPHAVFHASTQTSLGSLRDITELYKLGFSRLVLPRELNREEIRALADGPLEIEIFIHGAHCVSCSGQCLMSYFCGGRSGNRGECAQPCRLPYEVRFSEAGRADPVPAGGKTGGRTGTPLSLADMCLAGRMRDVISTGVTSLKIEGRLKSAPYVYGVTEIYRRLLDEARDAEPEEIRALERLFARGFTDGFYTGRYGGMRGRPAEETANGSAVKEEIAKAYAERLRRAPERTGSPCSREDRDGTIPLTASFTMKRDRPAVFVLKAEQNGETHTGTAAGEIPAEAEGRPLDPGSAARNLIKLGGTGFSLSAGDIRFDLDGGLWMPAAKLNDLRRRAAEDLRESIRTKTGAYPEGAQPDKPAEPCEPDKTSPAAGKFPPYEFPAARKRDGETDGTARRTLELADAGVLRRCMEEDPGTARAIFGYFDKVFVPWDQYGMMRTLWDGFPPADAGCDLPELCAVLPVFPLAEDVLRRAAARLKEEGCRRILAHGIGAASLTEQFSVELSFRGNVTNGAAAAVYRDAGFERIGLSPELPAGGIRALGKAFDVSCIAYGRIPVMTTARCALKEKNRSCRGRGGRTAEAWKTEYCAGSLTDRKGEVFPVFGGGDCVNTVYNAKPVWMGDRLGELDGADLCFFWTTETTREMRGVLERYERGEAGEGRRIQ
jgi:putative protease